MLRRFRTRSQVEVPTWLLEKSARNYLPNLLADLIVDDILAGEMLADQVHKVGRTDSAFYRDRLPPQLQPLVKPSLHSTVSSSKLIQAMFAEDFKTNAGWLEAKKVYAAIAAQFVYSSLQGEREIEIGTIDPELKGAMHEKLKGRAEVIVRYLLGHPVSLKNSPLPERLTDFLVHCDQRFHMQLMKGERTRHFTSHQMRDARIALQKQLLVTYLLQPMLSGLAPSRPSQTEIWLLSLLMYHLLVALPPLNNDVFAQSFATSPKRFREAVQGKHEAEERQERIEKQRRRTEQRKATFKTRPGHVRSRSAETPLIDTRSLPTREQILQQRAKKKSEKLADEFDGKISEFESVLKEAEKNVEEHEQIRKAQTNLQDFSSEDLQLVLDILDDRDREIDFLIELAQVSDLTPRRAEPLVDDDSDSEPVETVVATTATTATTANTVSTIDSTTTVTGTGDVDVQGREKT